MYPRAKLNRADQFFLMSQHLEYKLAHCDIIISDVLIVHFKSEKDWKKRKPQHLI